MRRCAIRGSDSNFVKGRRELARHRPDLAVRSLRTAVEACSPSRPGELARSLYWLAISLLRLDRPELAVRSLASAIDLRPRGIYEKAYSARVNEYGMCRRSSRAIDDFYAFFSIQAGRYFCVKGKHSFDSCSEKDAVTRLIGDAWHAISRSGKLNGLTASRKMALFESSRIEFPVIGLRETGYGKVLSVDFKATRDKGQSRPSKSE